MKKGMIASKGFCIGKVFHLEKKAFDLSLKPLPTWAEAEALLEASKERCIHDLARFKEKLFKEESEIFQAHIEMVKDPEIEALVNAKIKAENVHPAVAYKTVTDTFIETFKAMDDEYFKQRATDIEDVQYRMVMYLTNQKPVDLRAVDEATIIVAKDLTPSDTASFNFDYVKGFITEEGGFTSHTAIMARSLNIPALIGVKDITKTVKSGDVLILDALNHEITINPNQETLNQAEKKRLDYLKSLEELHLYRDKKTVTKDDQSMPLFANIGSDKDLSKLSSVNPEGVGLFRTEFLFMDRETMPTEDEQVVIYEKVFEAIEPVIVRTLDIGGDKALPYLTLPKEENPFLGVRAIRLCFQEEALFKTQLRALLKAGLKAKELSIMFPMIARVDELLKAKSLLDAVKRDLDEQGSAYQRNIRIGIMIEIPSAAFNAKELAKHADFFSIGTNDLIQYLYAADRMNDQLDYLYDPLDPTLLRLIHHVIEAAHEENIHVGVCGEMASDERAALLLVGMGIDELSMNPGSILPLRKSIHTYTMKELKELAHAALRFTSSKDVNALFKKKEA